MEFNIELGYGNVLFHSDDPNLNALWIKELYHSPEKDKE